MYDNRPLMLNNNAHSAKLHLHFTWKCLKNSRQKEKEKSKIHTHDDQDKDCQMMLIF